MMFDGFTDEDKKIPPSWSCSIQSDVSVTADEMADSAFGIRRKK